MGWRYDAHAPDVKRTSAQKEHAMNRDTTHNTTPSPGLSRATSLAQDSAPKQPVRYDLSRDALERDSLITAVRGSGPGGQHRNNYRNVCNS